VKERKVKERKVKERKEKERNKLIIKTKLKTVNRNKIDYY